MSSDKYSETTRLSYSGYGMPVDVRTNGLEEESDEPTRRVAFMPGYEPTAPFIPVALDPGTLTLPLDKTLQTSRPQSKGSKINLYTWKVQNVPVLPENYSLERTSAVVTNTPPAVIAQRICAILRQRSIEASYDDEKAKVRCTTMDGVDFHIFLYRVVESRDQSIIVEVQRRFGTSNMFHVDVMAILDAVEGKMSDQPQMDYSLPLILDEDDDYQPCGITSLKLVAKMLESDDSDSCYLAFRTLQSLTDGTKVGAKTAEAVAQALFTSKDGPVLRKLLHFILDSEQHTDIYKLHSMAMVVLANALQAVQGKVDASLWDKLRSAMISELRIADSNQLNAMQAARAIEYRLYAERRAEDLHSALSIALNVGALRHAALESQARRCLAIYGEDA